MDSLKPLALISVYDKSGLLEFVQSLLRCGFSIISTGGTSKYLKNHGIDVLEVSDYTDTPSIFSNRVKTLHPKIHGGILYNRNSIEHRQEALAHNIRSISLVAVNFYPFEEFALKQNLSLETGIEYIDIGGPSMLRAAAKNWEHCIPIVDPEDYSYIAEKFLNGNEISKATRIKLASKVFEKTCSFDQSVEHFFKKSQENTSKDDQTRLPNHLTFELNKTLNLRYGENPQQDAAVYSIKGQSHNNSELLHGKALSYNNLLDIESGTKLIGEFKNTPAVAILKHNNPCGCASGHEPLHELFKHALAGDPVSSFGGIVVTNEVVDIETAIQMNEIFLECIIAKDYSQEAFKLLSNKKNLRILKNRLQYPDLHSLNIRNISEGILLQTPDHLIDQEQKWEVVTGQKISKDLHKNLAFAMKVASHAKSNAIVISKNFKTVCIAAGHTSRIDALEFAAFKASKLNKSLKNAVMASDAFFPFDDCVKMAANLGIIAIIQPGGSIRDNDSIKAAENAGLTMVFTGNRHFRH